MSTGGRRRRRWFWGIRHPSGFIRMAKGFGPPTMTSRVRGGDRLEVYFFADDETGHAFADLLCQKAQEGVRVFVIYDSSHRGRGRSRPCQRMRQCGVHVKVFHPTHPGNAPSAGGRSIATIASCWSSTETSPGSATEHRREYAGSWVGRSKLSPCEFWRDNAIGVSGPDARVLLQAFAQTWRYVNHGGRIRRVEFIHNLFEGELGVLAPARR